MRRLRAGSTGGGYFSKLSLAFRRRRPRRFRLHARGQILQARGQDQHSRVYETIHVCFVLLLDQAQGDINEPELALTVFLGARVPKHCVDIGVHRPETQSKDQ